MADAFSQSICHSVVHITDSCNCWSCNFPILDAYLGLAFWKILTGPGSYFCNQHLSAAATQLDITSSLLNSRSADLQLEISGLSRMKGHTGIWVHVEKYVESILGSSNMFIFYFRKHWAAYLRLPGDSRTWEDLDRLCFTTNSRRIGSSDHLLGLQSFLYYMP